ncbi:MAG TPA: alkaline phosphatase family protein, partial [Candidatus Sulfotelmatobacter sp.]|nr:alkaline phosphatase family protein [Candidatus Sulfotelmatobacter sp.]
MHQRISRQRSLLGFMTAFALTIGVGVVAVQAEGGDSNEATSKTTTPIKHLVVLFQENVSFDHYFGTYPIALNPGGEPQFTAAKDTPSVNGLTASLLTNNPNLSNPQRLDRSQALTCDQGHGYTAEQKAFDAGLMDKFVQFTGASKTVQQCTGQNSGVTPNYAVMDYYDGNTVTALWNYAQRYAMSDNSYSTGFGPSTPGAFEVVAGNTFGTVCGPASAVYAAPVCPAGVGAAGSAVAQGPGTTYSDADPYYDKCSNQTRPTIAQGGTNIGDLLNAAGGTWGWFQGGFRDCTATHNNVGGSAVTDYNAHHEPFQYYPQTANPQHLPPTSVAMIGRQDQANHQYDLTDFWAAATSGHLPAVSYLKAASYQDGHAGYSDPLDEQNFLVTTINRLETLPTWGSTAVVIAYDDSDGWYDHLMAPIVNQSQTALDALTGTNQCGSNPARVTSGQQARCGFGPRQPLLVISPFARRNFVDGTLTDQSSIVRFIEDNWSTGRVAGGSLDAQAG